MKFRPSRRDRPAFGKLSNEYDLTYCGTVLPEDNDYTTVRGITASPDQIDENYCVGIVSGYQVQLLQRSHDLYGKDNSCLPYTWSILQIDLQKSVMPHVFVDGLGENNNYGSLLASYLRMYEVSASSLGIPLVEHFNKTFSIYIYPDDIPHFRPVLSTEVQNMLASYFANIDFEFDKDKLIVYSTEIPIQLATLDRMLRIGIWLARKVDNIAISAG